MKVFVARTGMALIGWASLIVGGCSVEADHHTRYYRRDGWDGYYSRGYYVPARREPRVVVEPRVRVYTQDRW